MYQGSEVGVWERDSQGRRSNFLGGDGNRRTMQLTQLAQQLAEAKLMGNALVGISAVTYDSRQVQPGSLFVAVPGFQADGHDFLSQAISKGAAGLVVQANRQDRWRQIVAGAGAPHLSGARLAASPLRTSCCISRLSRQAIGSNRGNWNRW